MKKAFFSYQYGMANAGDFAINIGSLDLLNNIYDEITVVSKSTKSNYDFKKEQSFLYKHYNNIEVLEGPFILNRSSILNTIKSYVLGFVKYPYLLYRGKYNNEIRNSEILFLNGGNLLRCESLTDYVRLQALIFPLRLAKKNDRDYILLPQSTTSINDSGRKLLEPYLNEAKIVFAREEKSKEKLEDYFPDANIVNSLDTAFFIKDRELIKKEFIKKYKFMIDNKKNICITLRKEDIGDIGELSEETKSQIRTAIKEFVNNSLTDGYSVIFVIQTSKDKEFTHNVYNSFNSSPEVSIVEEYNPLILREICRNAACLFGMRLHSMILAMSVGTPVVGFFDQKWGIKNPGTLGQYFMPYSFINQNINSYNLLKVALQNEEKMVLEINRTKNNLITSLKNNIHDK